MWRLKKSLRNLENWRIKSKPSEEKSEEKEKKVERRIRIPVHKFQKGKTFLIILNLFYTYSRGEKSANKKKKGIKLNWKGHRWWTRGDQEEFFKKKFIGERNWW